MSGCLRPLLAGIPLKARLCLTTILCGGGGGSLEFKDNAFRFAECSSKTVLDVRSSNQTGLPFYAPRTLE